MARFAIKALVVTALVCLVFDCSRAAETQQQGLDSLQEAAKGQVTEFMNSNKQTASETYNKVQEAVKESENNENVESQLSNFFSGAFTKLKNSYNSALADLDRFVLAASDENYQQHGHDVLQQTVGYGTANKDVPETSTSSSSFKDKFKGFVSSVKEGASETLETLNEKRKEAYAGTKKIVNGAIDKIKHTFDKSSSEVDEPRVPDSSSSEEHVKDAVKDAANKAKDAAINAKDAVVDKTQNFMKSEKLN